MGAILAVLPAPRHPAPFRRRKREIHLARGNPPLKVGPRMASLSRDPCRRPRPAPAIGRSLWCALLLVSAVHAGEKRVWTSLDGKTVTAELVDATETTVTIRNEAGREFTFSHDRLSQADRDVIQAHLARKKAEHDSIVWPKANGEQAIPAPFFKKLHGLDAKKFNATYPGRVLAIQGNVLDVREDRASGTPGILVTLDTEDKVPVELKFNKANYDRNITLLLGRPIERSRGYYEMDEVRVRVVDKSIVIERRYVTYRESYYNDTAGEYRYRTKWSDWEAVAKPIARGETVTVRGEFVSVFNSVMSFKDASLADPNTRLVTPSP
jgi:hypothetical protein